MGDSVADQQQEQRRAPRIKLFHQAELSGSAGTQRVHLLNVSVGGALVYAETPPAVGEPVRIDCGVALGEGRVAWRSGRQFGVTFAKKMDSSQIDALIRVQQELIARATQRLQLATA